jgi:hypothetical protein
MVSRLRASAEAATQVIEGRTRQQQAMVTRRVEYYDEESVAGETRYDVFINHRGVDTKRTVARLLYTTVRYRFRGILKCPIASRSATNYFRGTMKNAQDACVPN